MTSLHGRLIVVAIAAFALTASAYAQSPREQLQQMVEQLRNSPGDSALRERIIRLALSLKPEPALPDTAVRFEGRAQFAFRSAKSEGDFLAAAQEYEKAVAAAPWVPGYYSDLCTIYEKAGKFADAKRHCGFFLIGLTDPAQVTDVKRRIAGLEYGIEKANSPQSAMASKPAGPDFSGCWQGRDTAGTQYCDFSFERNGDSWIVRDSGQKPLSIVKAQGRQLWVDDPVYGAYTRHYALILSDDAQLIEVTRHDTQSSDEHRRLEAISPGGRLTELNVRKHSTMKKK
jgi:hypothetical protein